MKHYEALVVLLTVRDHLGHKFKAPIRQAWMDGNYSAVGLEQWQGQLQQIRNTLGPAWLNKVNVLESKTVARIEFLADIITTAVEGGINYWAEVRNYTHKTPPTTSVEVRDGEDSKGEWHKVTLDAIDSALGCIITDTENKLCAQRLRLLIHGGLTENDASHIDAEAADVILQVAALGKVVFG